MTSRLKVYIASPYTLGDVAVNVKRQLDTGRRVDDARVRAVRSAVKTELRHSSIAFPSRDVYHGHEYVPAVKTDIAKTFARFGAEQAKPARGLREVSKQR